MSTPARQCNNALANAWQAAASGEKEKLKTRLTAAMLAAEAANLLGLSSEIDYARQNVDRVVQIYLVAMINRLWYRAESRCIEEEKASRSPRRQLTRVLSAA